MDAPSPRTSASPPKEDARDARRAASQQPNERLVLLVKDFSLVSRLLNVRIYQVFHTTAGARDSVDFVGFRIAATDEVENDYALFISRVKGEQLCLADLPDRTERPSPEAIAGSILSYLDITGNRHRDVGRLTCREPEVHVDHKPRGAPPPRPRSASKQRNVHLQSKTEDKRASRTKKDKQRAMDAIAASHNRPHDVADETSDNEKTGHGAGRRSHTEESAEKSRKASEASLLHRMAHPSHAAVYRTDLEDISDETSEQLEEEESEAEELEKTPPHSTTEAVQYKRALPNRKPKYTELQRRRDEERKQRLQIVRPVVVRTPPTEQKQSSLNRTALSTSPNSRRRPSAASAIGNAFALKAIVVDSVDEQEQFLRRKTILENHNRVLKAEGVFDDSMGVEITHLRPDRRFHTPEHAPPSADPTVKKRKPSTDRRRSAATVPKATLMDVEDGNKQPLSGSASAPVLPSPRELVAVARSPEVVISDTTSAAGDLLVIEAGDTTTEQNLDPTEIENPSEPVQASAPADESAIESNSVARDVVVMDPASASAPDEDSAIESITLADEVVVMEAEDPSVELVDESANGPGESAVPYTPRSTRGSGVIHIHEEEPPEQDVADATSSESSQERQFDEGESSSPLADQLAEPIISPRVECWEEVNTSPGEHELREQNQLNQSDEAAGETEVTNAMSRQWAARFEETVPEAEHAHSALGGADQKMVENTVEEETLTRPSTAEMPAQDPIVEVEAPPQAVPDKDEQHDEAALTAVTSKPPSLRRIGSAVSSRRGSILDAAASAIALAAAAAAVTATIHSPVESSILASKSSLKNETKRKRHKRRSHDATSTDASPHSSGGDPTASKRDGPRRSTIHLFHSSTRSKQAALPSSISSVQPETHPESSSEADSSTAHGEDHDTAVLTPSSTTSSPSDVDQKATDRVKSHRQQQHHNRQRSQHEVEALHKSPSYHVKWHKWSNGKQLIDKVSCLQIEEQLLQDPSNASNLMKLGLRYARWPATSLPSVLLLENAAVVQDGASGHSHDYWNSLGNAHFDVFLRHRKFLPVAVFHLSKSSQAFTRAFAYLESVADPLLLLRYAICLYWKKSEDNTNVAQADDILRELFGKFASFCDKDRPNLLFFHFQILCRLRMFNEAIECLNKIMTIHGEAKVQAQDGSTSPTYDSSDYLLMLMHCQQASGDFLQASATFKLILKRLHEVDRDILADGSTLSDQDYLHMWCALADKCFHLEDYALAIEFYAIAVTYAKDSCVLARVLYNHALCYQAIGEGIKCSAEFKRAKNINRHVIPFATLADIHSRYDDQYNVLLRTPVASIIADVRQNLYDRAVTSLQRVFRRKKKAEENAGSGNLNGSSPGVLQRIPSGTIRLDRRRQSVVDSLTNLVEESSNRRGSARSAGSPHNTNDVGVVDPHEAYLQRHAVAMEKLQKLRGQHLKKTSSMRISPTKHAGAAHSGLLSPTADRPDLRRKHSMDSLARRLGYLPENREQFAGYWQQLVTTSLHLYETQTVFHRLVAQIRSVLPLVSETVACCALADAMGNVHHALERLHDTIYEQELQFVSTVVDITTILQRHFGTPTETTERTRFPPINSPVKTQSSPAIKYQPVPLHKQVSLPPCKSPSPSGFKAVRLASIIDAQFQNRAHVDESGDRSEPPKLREMDRFVLVDDFRAVNASLLHGWKR